MTREDDARSPIRSPSPIVSPFHRTLIAKLESGEIYPGPAEQGQPPPVLRPFVKPARPLSRFRRIALCFVSLGAVVTSITGARAAPITPVFVQPPRGDVSDSHTGRDPLAEVVQRIFDYFADRPLDEAYEALAEHYAELLRNKRWLTSEEQEQLDRFPSPDDPADAKSIFASAWSLICAAISRAQTMDWTETDKVTFAAGVTMALEAAGHLSKNKQLLLGLLATAASMGWKMGIARRAS